MIHREGIPTIIVGLVISTLIWWAFNLFAGQLMWLGYVLIIILMVIILQFFRNPSRKPADVAGNIVLAPADGKIVVIEQVFETEYLKQDAIMVSIFMSPLNVHVNRNPVDAVVSYYKYHPGTYLAAWHPKSSTENERTTIGYTVLSKKIVVRQIAGALARRIVNYLKEGQSVIRGSEMGFIKFGSRVDLYLPLDSKILVKIDEKVSGNLTSIAEI